MKQYLYIAAALLVGVGLGYLIFGGRSGDAQRDAAGVVADRSAGPGVSQGAVGGLGKGPGLYTGRPRRPAATLLHSVRERNAQLTRENGRLVGRLSEVEQDLLFARGKPEPWPDTAPSRLTRKAVLHAMNRALGQAGLDGEVTDVDCKEFPCVLSGRLKGQVSAAQFKKILSSKAMRAYRDDHAQTSITTRSGSDSVGRPWTRSHFAISLMLAGPAGTEPDVKRTVYRLRQLLDAATGQ